MNQYPYGYERAQRRRTLPDNLRRCACGRLYEKPYVGFKSTCDECASAAYRELEEQKKRDSEEA